MRQVAHQIWWYMGETSPSGWPYLFWSGFGGCIRDLLLLFAGFHLGRWHHHREQERKRETFFHD